MARTATELFASEASAAEHHVPHKSQGDDGVPVHWRSAQFAVRTLSEDCLVPVMFFPHMGNRLCKDGQTK